MARSGAVRGSEPQTTTLRELEEEGKRGSVYVVNMSSRESRGRIVFSVPRQNGNGEDIVKIPKTWIPVDLTEQVQKEQLLNSARFRTKVSQGLLKLIHPDYAEKILESEGGMEEKQRIDNEDASIRAKVKAQVLTGKPDKNEPDDVEVDPEHEDGRKKTPTEVRREKNKIKEDAANSDVQVTHRGSPVNLAQSSFSILLERMKGKTDTQILNALRSEGTLRKSELKAVIKMFGDRDRVRAWVNKKLDAVSA